MGHALHVYVTAVEISLLLLIQCILLCVLFDLIMYGDTESGEHVRADINEMDE